VTQNLLAFNDLPVGSQITVPLSDRGQLAYGQVVPPSAVGSIVTSLAQVKIVSKAGNDATADGSIALPFLTVQAAINSISDASTAKPYEVWVLPGVYVTSFTLAPSIFVIGSGPRVTFLSPAAANCLSAAWAGTGLKVGGMANATLSTALKVDYAAIGSTGAGGTNFWNLELLSPCILTGATSTNYVRLSDVFWEGFNGFGQNLVITDLAVCDLFNVSGGFGNLTVVGHDAYFQEVDGQGVSLFNALSITWTGTTVNNALDCIFDGPPAGGTSGSGGFGQPVITGQGAIYSCPSGVAFRSIPSEADLQFNPFAGTGAAGGATAIIGCDLGTTHVVCGPSGGIVLQIRRPTNGTRLSLKNQSAFNITLDFGVVASSGPSYVGPFGYAEMWFSSGTWEVEQVVQSGTVDLVNGVSPFITADISASSRIVATMKTFNGATGIAIAKGTDRVNGTNAGGGGFKITSVSQAAGATVVTDQGTYEWHVFPGK